MTVSLRNVPITKYSHLGTNTTTFSFFYSLTVYEPYRVHIILPRVQPQCSSFTNERCFRMLQGGASTAYQSICDIHVTLIYTRGTRYSTDVQTELEMVAV